MDAVDPEALERLLARVGDLHNFDRPRPLVTVEEFFEGNDDPGSFGYNLDGDDTEPRDFFRLFGQIRDRPDVEDVMVEVKHWENEPGWPSSDTVHIITTATPAAVASWFPKKMAPDEWGSHAVLGPPSVEAYDVPAGYRAVFVFFD